MTTQRMHAVSCWLPQPITRHSTTIPHPTEFIWLQKRQEEALLIAQIEFDLPFGEENERKKDGNNTHTNSSTRRHIRPVYSFSSTSFVVLNGVCYFLPHRLPRKVAAPHRLQSQP